MGFLGGLLGKANPLRVFRGYFKRHPWQKRFLVALPFLLVLALVQPVFDLLDRLIGLLERLLAPMLDSGAGRAVLLVLLFVLLSLAVYLFAKERLRNLVRRYALATHLRGIEQLLLGRKEAARRTFRKVLRIGRWCDLERGPLPAFGSLSLDARIKLARMALEEGWPRRARTWLAGIPSSDLGGRLALSLAELNARVFSRHPDHLPESVLGILQESHRTWPGHPGICDLLVQNLLEAEKGEEATRVLATTMKRTDPEHVDKVRQRLAGLELRLAREALLRKDGDLARRLLDRSLKREETEEGLLLRADLHLANEDLDLALRVLSDLATPASKERIRKLLDRDRLRPRKLLSQVPRKDALCAIAEHYLERGEFRKAHRSLRAAIREGSPAPRIFALLARLRLEERAPLEASEALRLALTTEEGQGA